MSFQLPSTGNQEGGVISVTFSPSIVFNAYALFYGIKGVPAG
jgi:hypothetical protein